MSWMRYLRRRQWDEERARELESYLAIETDDNLARGLSPDDARRAAYRTLGNPTLIREEIYRMNTATWLETTVLDARDAWRQLKRRPVTATVGLALLAIGVGASTAAFSVAYGVLARPLAFPDADRLATLWQVERGVPQQLSFPDLLDIRAAGPLSHAVALASGRATLMTGADVDRVNLVEGEPPLLPMLGATAALGRLIDAGDAGQPVAVLGRRLWAGPFRRDPAIVGRTFSLSGRTLTVVGVLAEDPEFELPVGAAAIGQGFRIEDVDLWLPLDPRDDIAQSRSISTYEALVKLDAPDAIDGAQRALDVVAANLARQYPDSNRNRGFRLVPLSEQVVAGTVAPITLALGGGLLILIIACGNLVSLFLAELPSRLRDFALREALGAGRARLLRQAIVESVLLSAIGGGTGLVVATALVRGFEAAVDLPRVDAIRFDVPVLLFALVSAVLAALTARWLPLLGRRPVVAGLRPSATRYATSAPRLRRTLVATQIAFALVLSTGAVLFGVSLQRLAGVDPGYAAPRVLSLRVSAFAAQHPAKADVARFFDEVIARASLIPGVEMVAAASALPLTGSTTGTSIVVDGRPVPMADRPSAGWQTVTPGYFATLGMPIRAGRDFAPADRERPGHRVVVNETLARRLFGTDDPIGRRIGLGADEPVEDWHEIVGVVGDVRHASLAETPIARAYDLFGQHWSRTMFVVTRGGLDPYAAAPMIRRVVGDIDPGAPVFDVRSLDDLRAASTAPRRASTILAFAVAAISVLLATIGAYGLLAGSVAARTRELGIRIALGASPQGIQRLVLVEGAALAAAGVAAGAAMSLASGRYLESQLYGVRAADPVVIGATTLVLLAVTAVATLIPARRAARIDPVRSLVVEE